MVNLEGVRFLPKDRPSKTLAITMHPSASQALLPVPRALAARGVHMLCAGNRYFRNDTPLIMEKGGARPRRLRAPCPRGDGLRKGRTAGLVPRQAAGPVLSEPGGAANRDPDPGRRDRAFDIYDPKNPNQPPYSDDFIAAYRSAQETRMHRRRAWVKETLDALRKRGGKELERGFVTHRTMADLRFMDPAVDPNDRRPRWCHLGDPESANSGPAGLGRYSTLRAWLSQWSPDDSNVDGPRGASAITVPLLVVENTADEACPPQDPKATFEAAASTDKTYTAIKGATHYFQGQPELLQQATDGLTGWLESRRFRD